jgi:catechol 2,3-dioxygenase-like lactoylglutathione lyase family enzyme
MSDASSLGPGHPAATDPPAPRLAGVLETALYADSMPRARAFYEGVLQLTPMFADARLCAYAVGDRTALLVFQRGGTSEPVQLPDGRGVIPGHDASGSLHCAMAIGAADLPDWEARLAAHGVPVEARVHWPRGSTSVYFRDPDGHLLELATPGLWPVW